MSVIKIADSDLAFECGADDTITRAGLRAGLAMPYECNVGSCGNCKIELIEGATEPAWPAAPALSERDRSKNRVLGCQAHPRADCMINVRLAEQFLPVYRPQRFRATLSAVRDITHDIREFDMQADTSMPFLSGQYALVTLPGVAGQRAYSMSSACPEKGSSVWQFQIKRMPGGAGTAVLFDQLRVGDQLAVDGPYGHAQLREDCPRDVVCISGGSGISPMLSIARAMMASPRMAARKMHFFYGGRTERDICGEAVLRELSGFGERLFYHPSLSMTEEGDGWTGHRGFVHENVLAMIGGVPAEFEYYFAGPPAMTQATQRMLMKNKVPLSQMHFDAFY